MSPGVEEVPRAGASPWTPDETRQLTTAYPASAPGARRTGSPEAVEAVVAGGVDDIASSIGTDPTTATSAAQHTVLVPNSDDQWTD